MSITGVSRAGGSRKIPLNASHFIAMVYMPGGGIVNVSGIWHPARMVVSVEQAAQQLGCKRRRVFQLLADGILEKAPRYGREIRIYTASVERALAPTATQRRKARGVGPIAPRLENLPVQR